MEGLHEPENKIMSFIMSYCFSVKKAKCDSLREKCPYSELFSMNTKRYGVSLRIKSECSKI